MGVTDHYRSASDLPKVLPVFPLRGAILLPRASLTLNVFEPRYLALVDTALASDRLMGVVQPSPDAGLAESPIGKEFPLRRIGCAGRIVGFTENDDGRMGISLAGIARFALGDDVASEQPFRICAVDFTPYAGDFMPGQGEEEVDRPRVNALAILSPYGPEEKQCLLEAKDLRARADALVALAEMELAARDDGSGTSLQ